MSFIQELALLYVKKHATPESTPEEIYRMYSDALERITQLSREKRQNAERPSLLG